MPNVALIPGADSRVPLLTGLVDGYPTTEHRLETTTGGEPLEDGARITDHAVARQALLTLEGWVSDWESPDRPRAAWERIRELHKAVTPLEVITEWGRYTEMLIRRAETTQTGRGMRFRIELEEIVRVGVTESELPPDTVSGPAAQRTGNVERGRIPLSSGSVAT